MKGGQEERVLQTQKGMGSGVEGVVMKILSISYSFVYFYFFGFHEILKNKYTKDNRQTRSERCQRGSSSRVLVAKCIFCCCIKDNNFKAVTSLDLSAEKKIWMAVRELHDE